MASFSDSQYRAIEVAERVGSVFSLLGAAFILSTFLLSDHFRKPINRLVFYAAWGNVFTNVATIISRDGITLGVTSHLCQFQAFLIQMFMPADALWTFAMAFNVWLTFFRQYDAPGLRSLEWIYLALCYGIPFVPALAFLFIKTAAKGEMYGSAVLWCWVASDWDVFRLATFYGPVWVVIILTMFIYFQVGSRIFRLRRQLMSIGVTTPVASPKVDRNTRTEQDLKLQRFGVVRTYEVTVSSDAPDAEKGHKRSFSASLGRRLSGHNSNAATTAPSRPEVDHGALLARSRTIAANKATIHYCKCAMLFFMALLVTWVPSTVNRVYSIVYPGRLNFGLEFTAALVLTLQGFWNTIIYVVTSLPACRALFAELNTSARRGSVGVAQVCMPRAQRVTSDASEDSGDIDLDLAKPVKITRHDHWRQRIAEEDEIGLASPYTPPR